MKCLYCGGQIISSDKGKVCAICGRNYTQTESLKEQAIFNNDTNISSETTDLNSEEKKINGVDFNGDALKKNENVEKGQEEVAKEEVVRKISSLDEMLPEISETKDFKERLGYDFSSYKVEVVEDKEMIKEFARDFKKQTTRNAGTFGKMINFYGKEVIDNFKKNIKTNKKKKKSDIK